MSVISKTLVGAVALAGSATDTYLMEASPLTKNVNYAEVRILCTTSSQVVDVTLPEISAFAGNYGGLKVIVQDISSNAATRNITVRAGGSDKINDAATAVIALDGGSLMLVVSAAGIWSASNAPLV